MSYNPQYPGTTPGHYPQHPGQPQMPYVGYGTVWPIDQLRGPSKRAGGTMIALACLMLLCGGCVGASSVFFTESLWQQMGQQMASQGQELPPDLDRQTVHAAMIGIGIGGLVLGLLTLILGIFTFKGGKIACVLSLILIGILAVLQLVNIVASAVGATRNPSQWVGVVIGLIILSVLGLTLFWLVQAIKNADQIVALRSGGGYPPQGYGYPNPYQQPYSQQPPYQQQQPPQQPPQQ